MEKINQIPSIPNSEIINQKLVDLKELFYNAKNPVAVLLQEMDIYKHKPTIDQQLLIDITDKLKNLSFDNADDFANTVAIILTPLWEVTHNNKDNLLKQEHREMFSQDDIEKTVELIKEHNAQEIYIIGTTGSGKSTFSKELATKTKHKNIDLDHFFQIFKQENNKEASLEEVLEFAKQRLQPPYIINHADLLRQNLVGDADCIILLNPTIEEQLKSRELRTNNTAEGEWQKVDIKDYKKINEDNLHNFENIQGDLLYKNIDSGTCIKFVSVRALTKDPKLPGKLGQLGWPLELQGKGETNSEKNKIFDFKFPVGDIFLSYATTIHELGHLRQESLDPSLENIPPTVEGLYAQELDAWDRGWERFLKANPNLMETLKEKFKTYKNQGKITFESFEDLYSWIKQNVLKTIEYQGILFEDPNHTPETKQVKKDYIADELEKNGIKQFFADYKALRVGEKVEESEIREAINKTIELIIKE